MSRYCLVCNRAKKACICSFTEEIKTHIEVIILQHPTEVKQAKGSAAILSLTLPNSKCFVGEDFTDHLELNTLLSDDRAHTFLLFPSEQSIQLDTVNCAKLRTHKIMRVILVDGTWRKAYKIIRCSQNLHSLPCLSLPEAGVSGQYRIRKAAQSHQLSTLEAGYEILSRLEPDTDFTPLMTAFHRMIEQYLSYVPESVRNRHYSCD